MNEREKEREKKLIRATPTFPFFRCSSYPNNDGDEAVKVACAVKYACIAGRVGASSRRHLLAAAKTLAQPDQIVSTCC